MAKIKQENWIIYAKKVNSKHRCDMKSENEEK